MAAVGRNDSLATGSYREANLQRQLSGDEPEASSVATRPNPARWPSPEAAVWASWASEGFAATKQPFVDWSSRRQLF